MPCPEEKLAGTEIQVAGGRMLDCRDTGCPVGTRIEIRNLFFNVPARRKFLRAESTEFRHIDQVVRRIALGCFPVELKLQHNQRQVLHLAHPAPVVMVAEHDVHRVQLDRSREVAEGGDGAAAG